MTFFLLIFYSLFVNSLVCYMIWYIHINYNLKHYTEINPAAYETEYVRFEKYDANVVVTDKVIAKDDFGIQYMKPMLYSSAPLNQAPMQDFSKTFYDLDYSKYVPITIENERHIHEYLASYKIESSDNNFNQLIEKQQPFCDDKLDGQIKNEIENIKQLALQTQHKPSFSSNNIKKLLLIT